jgi:hypothetical protein
MINSLLQLLYKNKDSLELEQLFESVTEVPEFVQYPKQSFYSFKKSGIELEYDERSSQFKTVRLYIHPSEGYSAYHDQLPFELVPADDRKSVRLKIGTPRKSGEHRRIISPPPDASQDEMEAFFKHVKQQPLCIQWDLYVINEYAVNIQFDLERGGTISQIVMMTPDDDILADD